MHFEKLNKEKSDLVALFNLVPVQHFLSSLAILYHVIAHLQKAHCNWISLIIKGFAKLNWTRLFLFVFSTGTNLFRTLGLDLKIQPRCQCPFYPGHTPRSWERGSTGARFLDPL